MCLSHMDFIARRQREPQSSRGQITIPKAIRIRLRLKVGDRLRFVVEPDGSLRLHASTRDVSTLGDILFRPKRRASVDEMLSVVRKHAAKRAIE